MISVRGGYGLAPNGNQGSILGGTRRWWLMPHTLIMGLVFAGALAAGYYVLPGSHERIAALERDGQFSEALRILEQRFERGDRSQQTLFQLQRLYQHFGELGNAKRTFEMLAKERPRDVRVQRQLAQFYKETQNEAGYLASLHSQLSLRYSEPICRELVGIYRRNGDFQSEQATIESCRARGYRRTGDIIRLAYLVAADGELSRASELLRTVDDRRRLKTDRDRLMLFTSLLEANKADEAQKRALRWIKASRDDALTLLLIDNLAKENRYDLAIGLAREAGVPGDSISLAVAELMLDRNETTAARIYLKGWLDVAQVRDPDVVQRFISAALDAEDPDLAFLGADSHGLARLGQGELAALAEALSALGRVEKFEKVRATLDPTTLRDNPLLAAAIEVNRGAAEPARQLLSQVQVNDLDEWRLALWARLMQTAGRQRVAAPSDRNVGAEPLPDPPQASASAVPPRGIRRVRPTALAKGSAARVTARRKYRGPPVPPIIQQQPAPQSMQQQ